MTNRDWIAFAAVASLYSFVGAAMKSFMLLGWCRDARADVILTGANFFVWWCIFAAMLPIFRKESK